MTEALDSEAIIAALDLKNKAFFANLRIFKRLGSTNDFLLAAAKKSAPSGTICITDEQIRGRGRLRRPWATIPGGSIACSVLWRFERLEHISALSIAIAVMVIRALRRYGVSNDLQLKWPNDVLFDRRKLAGILLERCQDAVVIGIGLNLVPQQDERAGLQEIVGQPIRRNFLIGLILNELLNSLPVFANEGLAPFLEDWQQHDCLIHQPVNVQIGDKVIQGVSQGINTTGELILKTPTGEFQYFCYGEVSARLNLEA